MYAAPRPITIHHCMTKEVLPMQPVTHPTTSSSTATPEGVLESIVTGINSGDLDSLMPLYEPDAAFATEPGSLAHGASGIRDALNGFIAMNGKLDLKVTRVLEADDLALVIGVWSFDGTGPDGEPVRLAAKNA